MKSKTILFAVVLFVLAFSSYSTFATEYVINPYKADWPLWYEDANGTYHFNYDPNQFRLSNHSLQVVNYIHSATVEVNIAEIKTLYSAPKTLLGAPGAHKFYKFLGATIIYDSNSAAYQVVGHNMTINYTNGSGAAVSGTLSGTGFLDQTTTDKIAQVIPAAVASTTGSSVDNQILVLSKATADPCGAGDGVLRVNILYQVQNSGL